MDNNNKEKRDLHMAALREKIRVLGLSIKHSPRGPYREQVIENWVEAQALHAAIRRMSPSQYGEWVKSSPQGQREAINGIYRDIGEGKRI